jgi:hypothetical protein
VLEAVVLLPAEIILVGVDLGVHLDFHELRGFPRHDRTSNCPVSRHHTQAALVDAILEDHPRVVKSFPDAWSTRCGAVAASDLDIVRRGDDSSAT